MFLFLQEMDDKCDPGSCVLQAWRVSTAKKPFAMLALVMSIFSLTSVVVLACWKLEMPVLVWKTSSFCEIARGDCICRLVYCIIISLGIGRGCSVLFVLAG